MLLSTHSCPAGQAALSARDQPGGVCFVAVHANPDLSYGGSVCCSCVPHSCNFPGRAAAVRGPEHAFASYPISLPKVCLAKPTWQVTPSALPRPGSASLTLFLSRSHGGCSTALNPLPLLHCRTSHLARLRPSRRGSLRHGRCRLSRIGAPRSLLGCAPVALRLAYFLLPRGLQTFPGPAPALQEALPYPPEPVQAGSVASHLLLAV